MQFCMQVIHQPSCTKSSHRSPMDKVQTPYEENISNKKENRGEMKRKFFKSWLLIFSVVFCISHAEASPAVAVSEPISIVNTTASQWRIPALGEKSFSLSTRFLIAGTLSFLAATISSGGGLYIPILIIVGGLDVKTASAYSAFMVTGGSIANVASQLFARSSGKTLIDYEIALLSQPPMLLGVSCGVVLNRVLPGWLITTLFVIFSAFCTFKTCKSGVSYWELESVEKRGNGCEKIEIGSADCGRNTEIPLLSDEQIEGHELVFRWMKLGMLVLIWLSFFVLNLLRGNKYGQGIIQIQVCGTIYWMISLLQIPIAIVFTAWILFRSKSSSSQQALGELSRSRASRRIIFPVMALLAGILGGVFGIGGGMLISPFLMQIGITPEVTAATCSFMVFFSSTMSAIQYLLLGMEQVDSALIYAAISFVASLIGLILVHQAIIRHGRASVIVFSVGVVLALSIVLMTGFGAAEAWSDYRSGKSMGFKNPC